MGAAAIPAIGMGVQAGQAVSSGIKGGKAASAADRSIGQQQQMVNDMFGIGKQAYGDMQNMMQDFDDNGNYRNRIDGMVTSGNQQMGQNMDAVLKQLGGPGLYQDAAQGLGQSASDAILSNLQNLGGLAQNNQVGNYRFDNVQRLQDQAIAAGRDEAARARTMAASQTGQAFNAGSEQLNAALAARGISGDSGQAVAGLTDLARSGAQTQATLENQLANQASQTALQFANLDNQNVLQRAQLESQYDLGTDQLLAQLSGQRSQLATQMAGQDTDRFNSLAGIQGQLDQRALAGQQLLNDTVNSQLQRAQGVYQQNYLQPQLDILGMLNPGALLSGAMQGQAGITQMYGDNAGAAGAGKGAATGGATQIASSMASGLKG